MSISEDLDEIEGLMASARKRVLYTLIPLLAVLVFISSQVPWSGIFHIRTFMPVLYWGFGNLVILALMALWYRSRAAATRRLVDLLKAGAFHMQGIEKTTLYMWHVFPIGYEVDLDSVSGDHFAFGFWTEYDADRLIALLAQSQVNKVSEAENEAEDSDDDG